MRPNPFSRARTTAAFRLLVISAKGGVGKSTTTVTLAAALTAAGQRVGIFDADLHGPNIPALLGVRQTRDLIGGQNAEGMVAIEARPDAMDARPLAPLARYGIGVMSLALLTGDQQAITPPTGTGGAILLNLLERIDWGGADVLLIDMPPGTGEPLRDLLAAGLADAAVIVTTREQLAHLDNGRLIGLLRRRGVPVLGVIENMTHLICPHCGERIDLYPRPAAAEAVYAGVTVLPALPFHPALIRASGTRPLPLRDPAALDDHTRAAHAACGLLAAAVQTQIAALRAAGPRPFPPLPDDDCPDC